MNAADWLPLAQRVLSCEWADDGWCETHDDLWPCDRAQEAADVLAEELNQPTKEQKMSKTTDDEGGIVRCGCGRAVPCRHCPTTPPLIDTASDLERAQEWLGCDTPPDSTWCEEHMHPLPCSEATRLAALLAEVAAEARAEGAADGIEGLMHELACHRDAELAARRADQWRAQAEQMRADQ